MPITRDGAEINDDQLLQALELGDVVLLYGGARPAAGLAALADVDRRPRSPRRWPRPARR